MKPFSIFTAAISVPVLVIIVSRFVTEGYAGLTFLDGFCSMSIFAFAQGELRDWLRRSGLPA